MSLSLEVYDQSYSIEACDDRLLELYSSFYSSAIFFEKFWARTQKNSYKAVIKNEDKIQQILFFKIDDKSITILNELFHINEEEIACLVSGLFSYFLEIDCINLRSVYDNFSSLNLQGQKIEILEQKTDAIISLPSSYDKYIENLGKKTREHIRYYFNRAQKQLPDLNIKTYAQNDILESQVFELINLSKKKFEDKNIDFSYDDAYLYKLLEILKVNGVLHVGEINNKIVSGTISSVFNRHAFLHHICSDVGFNKFNIGQIILVSTIQLMIEKDMDFYHLLWGKQEYKIRFGGVFNNLVSMKVHRVSS